VVNIRIENGVDAPYSAIRTSDGRIMPRDYGLLDSGAILRQLLLRKAQPYQ
jgi:hypothetical protein